MSCGGCSTASQKRLTLQRPAGTAGIDGHVDLTDDANWQTIATNVWGSFSTRGGSEGRAFDQVQADVSHIIEIPYRPSLTILPKWRLVSGSRVFNISAAYDVDEAHHTIRVHATEAV